MSTEQDEKAVRGEGPAFPCLGSNGLTKREEFAKAAMQGLVSCDSTHDGSVSIDETAEDAVRFADALLAALEASK